MQKMKHNVVKELWYNRPWVYIPAVIRFMKKYPFKRGNVFKFWIRNCFYLNWQVCFKRSDSND